MVAPWHIDQTSNIQGRPGLGHRHQFWAPKRDLGFDMRRCSDSEPWPSRASRTVRRAGIPEYLLSPSSQYLRRADRSTAALQIYLEVVWESLIPEKGAIFS